VTETAGQQLLRRAVETVGVEDVAAALKAPPALVEAWMQGVASMPDPKLLMLADFLDRLGRPEKG
jgi:hypothetical protein